MATVEEEIRRLSPGALSIFKRQAYEKARRGDPTYTRLVSMPELADIFQERELPTRRVTEAERQPEVPMWQRGLQWFGAPFQWLHEKAVEPFASTVTAGFTPSTPETEALPYWQREREEYKQWQAPWGVKGAIELMPWLAIPGIGAVGKAGQAGRGIAGALGKMGVGGKIAGKALEVSPWGLAEAGAGKAIGLAGKGIQKAISAKGIQPTVLSKLVNLVNQAKTTLPEQKLFTHQERVRKLAEAMPELESGTGEQAFINFLNKLKGEISDVSFTPVGEAITKGERDELFNLMKAAPQMRGYDFATGKRALDKIIDGILPVQSEIDILEKAFGEELAQALIKKMPTSKFWQAIDIANAPRAILASFDLSGLLRQGAILSARHPIEASKTVFPMMKSFLSDKNASLVDDIIMSRPHTRLAIDSGLYLAPLPASGIKTLSKMEEVFMSRFVDRVPLLGQVVRASNRAYVTVLNDLRSRTWEIASSFWEKVGANETDYMELARLINAASGRGSLKFLGQQAEKGLRGVSPILNATLFSPRLFLSRIEFPAMLASKSPLVRKEAARMLAQFLGFGTSIVTMATLLGAKTNMDSRSSDFGKIVIGNTRLDVWSGYSQWARFLSQLALGERKTVGGEIREVNRREVIDRFLQSKYSPAYGLLNDILRGETYMGEEVNLDTENLRRQAVQRLMPLFIQDMMDAVEQEGLVGGMVALPSVFGIGVVTYMSPVQKKREELAYERFGMNWEEVGKRFGNLAQREIENSSPELQELVKQEQERYSKTITGRADVNNRYRIEVGLVEEHYKKAIEQVTQEFRQTGDGTNYRQEIGVIADNRRKQYELLNMNPDYSKITDYFTRELTEQEIKRMSPKDIARRAYNQMMYGQQMYDEFGDYQFDMIEPMRNEFTRRYGLDMIQYVEDYQNIKEKDLPQEYHQLKEAKAILKPYWDIEKQVWADYPPELRQISKQIEIVGRTDERQERRMLYQYPQIVMARRWIALYRKQKKMRNPDIAQALNMFYRY